MQELILQDLMVVSEAEVECRKTLASFPDGV